MAGDLGSISIEVLRGAGVDQIVKLLEKGGAKDIRVIYTTDKRGVTTPAAVTAKSDEAARLQREIAAQGIAGRMASRQPTSPAAGLSTFQRVFNRKNLMQLNRSLFMMQMASLGVAFSFQSLQNQMLGIFAGLGDLGDMFTGNALSAAYSDALGLGKIDVFGTMGLSEKDLVNAWLGFQAITNIIQSLVTGLAAKILTPEMVSSIITVIGAIANELAKPEVVKAIQDIVIAVLDTVLQLVPYLPVLAQIITQLSDKGLLGVIIALIMVSPYLLAGLSLLQFGMQALILVVNAVTVVATLLGTSFAVAAGVIVGVLFILDLLIKIFEEFGKTGFSLDTIINGLIRAFNDVYNVVVSIMNVISNLVGMGNMFKTDVPLQWLWGNQNQASTTTSQTTNYINYGNISSDQKTAWKKYA